VSFRCREPRIVSELANDPFAALAHPIRREIVERLSGGATTVGEASRDLGVSKPTITRHLKMLEEAAW
jgi:DNA-binding transcriptional ArsR family regulator